MFSSEPPKPTMWSATGDALSDLPATDDYAGREAVLYKHQVGDNERSWGPDALPTVFQ